MQGRCFTYQPQWQPFPLLEVRADVVVTGLDVRLGLLKLARLIVKDATDMVSSGHFLQALILQVCFPAASAAVTTSLSIIMSRSYNDATCSASNCTVAIVPSHIFVAFDQTLRLGRYERQNIACCCQNDTRT